MWQGRVGGEYLPSTLSHTGCDKGGLVESTYLAHSATQGVTREGWWRADTHIFLHPASARSGSWAASHRCPSCAGLWSDRQTCRWSDPRSAGAGPGPVSTTPVEKYHVNKQISNFYWEQIHKIQICTNHRVIYYITYKVLSCNLRIIQKIFKPNCKSFWFLRQSIQLTVKF